MTGRQQLNDGDQTKFEHEERWVSTRLSIETSPSAWLNTGWSLQRNPRIGRIEAGKELRHQSTIGQRLPS